MAVWIAGAGAPPGMGCGGVAGEPPGTEGGTGLTPGWFCSRGRLRNGFGFFPILCRRIFIN